MSDTLRKLAERYSAALQRFLETGAEESLLEAYDIGRAAVSAKIGVLEMAALHQVALASVLLRLLPESERAETARRAGEFSAQSLVSFEITALGLREAQAMLKQLNETLEQKNAEINRQLEALRQLESLKNDLFSLIVHDLRNPIGGLMSCINLLEPPPGSPDPDGNREIARLAREGTRKLAELVDDILEVRLLEEGKLPVNPESVSLEELARQAAATLEGSAKLEGVRVEVEAPGATVLSLDRRLVRRAIENLISNALKFSAQGDAVTVSVKSAPGEAVVEVADRGPGVSAAVQERLFEKFGSVAPRDGGTRRGHGLGLYMVRLVARAHAGEVTAGAREGGGTVFRVSFPLGAPV